MTACIPCETAKRESWWADSIPRGFTHCSDCHQTYPGSNRFGHCTRCHRTFAGTRAFDMHQRITKEGEIAPDCLCSMSYTGTGEDTPSGGEQNRLWHVSASVTLETRRAEWGTYWAWDQPLPEAFGRSTK